MADCKNAADVTLAIDAPIAETARIAANLLRSPIVSADLGCPDAHANQPLVHSYFSDYLELSYGSHHNH